MVDHAVRLHYLEAMGIDVWISRHPAPSEALPAIEPAMPSPGADSTYIEPRPLNPLSEKEEWDLLQSEVAQCRKCSLCENRTQTVFGCGYRRAEWIIIGEAPGQQEDLQGQPFVGNAGLLLTEMLRAIGLSREEVYIANILKCRPPGNRDPKPEEAASCRNYLNRQLDLIRPKIILAVGRIAAQTLLETDEPLAKLRGKIHTLNDTPLAVVYHPAYLLRNLSDKRKAWLDLQFAMQTYRNIKG
ncbi:MAG: uracil-DNA glycosylase [Methylosarcina sp.]